MLIMALRQLTRLEPGFRHSIFDTVIRPAFAVASAFAAGRGVQPSWRASMRQMMGSRSLEPPAEGQHHDQYRISCSLAMLVILQIHGLDRQELPLTDKSEGCWIFWLSKKCQLLAFSSRRKAFKSDVPMQPGCSSSSCIEGVPSNEVVYLSGLTVQGSTFSNAISHNSTP